LAVGPLAALAGPAAGPRIVTLIDATEWLRRSSADFEERRHSTAQIPLTATVRQGYDRDSGADAERDGVPMTSNGTIDVGAIDSLRAGFRGQLIQPTDPDYDEARKIWNAMIDRRPALIARCTGTADVVAAVRFAREQGLPVAVRGGAHSAAGKGVVENGVVIDLSLMKGVHVDPASKTVRAEGGATWGDFDHETQLFGLAAPGGVISTTGIAGLTLGGGFGWLTRRFGLACDNLLSVDIVTASGECVTASEQENTDLFWGVRGGGGNFGVVTSFEYRLHEVGPLVLTSILVWPAERAAEVMRVHREATRTLPDEIGTSTAFVAAPPLPFVPEELHFKPAIVVLAVASMPNLDEGRRLLQPWLDLAPAGQMIEPLPYAVTNSLQDALMPAGRRSYWKAGYLPELSDEAIDIAADFGARPPSAFSLAEFVLWGGAVARVGADETAFAERDARFLFNFVSVWEDPSDDEASIAWARDFHAAMDRCGTGGVYVNFLSDEGDERVRAAYGAEKYARLASLKAKYDPDNFFRLNQNISPSG
jgi:FAD/FMN-containing dehydrogenase